MSRRERILHLARQNARTPLPEPVELPQSPAARTETEKADEEESERHVKERTIRERLWRLVGGNY
jgi:muconolactone delta-isomerase